MWKVLGKKVKAIPPLAAIALAALTVGCVRTGGAGWRDKLAAELPLLGHRNWILVADSAYPAQGRASIETIPTGASQIEVVKAVLKAVDDTKHVRATVYLDAEMEYVAEEDAPGIQAYRKDLAALLRERTVETLPHEGLIAKLDEAAKTFRVLVLKTSLVLPYTSIFLELDCGYWNSEAEQRLRNAIQQAK